MVVRYERRKYKTILNRYRFIDSWFWCRYSVNPYSGCEFACTYCDSRSHRYHLHPGFDRVIHVKSDVGRMLDLRLSRARTLLPDVVAIGGSGDAYQPAELEFQNTRRCLEVLLGHHYPVFLSTKSDLVKRDVDLLASIARDSFCTLTVTITTFDDDLVRFLEPGASPPGDRLGALEEVKRKRPEIQIGVNLMPVVPYMTDDEENLQEVVSRSRKAGVDFMLFGSGMTMRDDQARWFLTRLGEAYPELLPGYLELYEASFDPAEGYRGNYAAKPGYVKRVDRMILRLCEESGMPFRARRFIPGDFRRTNYLISEIFLNEAHEARIRGGRWRNLHWAGMNIGNLRESLEDVAERGELRGIRNVDEGVEGRIQELIERFRVS